MAMLYESGKMDWGREFQICEVVGINDWLCREIRSLDSLICLSVSLPFFLFNSLSFFFLTFTILWILCVFLCLYTHIHTHLNTLYSSVFLYSIFFFLSFSMRLVTTGKYSTRTESDIVYFGHRRLFQTYDLEKKNNN